MSADGSAAWALTRAIAPRRYVNRMIAEADGVVRSNSYPSKYPVNGNPPTTPWAMDLTSLDGRFWFAAFDLDAKTDDAFEQASEDLGVLVRILRDTGLPHVVCRSSPTGGFHVWLPLAGIDKAVMVQLADAARAVLPTLDHGMLCNDRTGAVRPPGAPHARGGASTVMAGADDVDVLRTPTVTAGDLLRITAAFRKLRPTVDPADSSPTGPVDTRHHAHRSLPTWGETHMATVAGGRDPSRTGYLCLLAAAVSGWTLADVEHAAKTAPGMEHYRTRNRPTGGRERRTAAAAAARLERQWAKAQERAVLYRYAPEQRAQRDLTELTGIVDVVDAMLQAFTASPGRWTRSEADLHDSTVLTYLAWLSLRTGSRDVAAALRSVAIATGIPSSTVDRSLRRLHEAGWISRRRQAEGPNAAVWRLTERFSTPGEHVGPLHDVTARPPAELFDVRAALLDSLEDRITAGRHDVFTRAGLGPTARRTYESLTTAEDTVVSVADRAGLPAAEHEQPWHDSAGTHSQLPLPSVGADDCRTSGRTWLGSSVSQASSNGVHSNTSTRETYGPGGRTTWSARPGDAAATECPRRRRFCSAPRTSVAAPRHTRPIHARATAEPTTKRQCDLFDVVCCRSFGISS